MRSPRSATHRAPEKRHMERAATLHGEHKSSLASIGHMWGRLIQPCAASGFADGSTSLPRRDRPTIGIVLREERVTLDQYEEIPAKIPLVTLSTPLRSKFRRIQTMRIGARSRNSPR